jgi:peptide/nickel transport system substrate-binding protein
MPDEMEQFSGPFFRSTNFFSRLLAAAIGNFGARILPDRSDAVTNGFLPAARSSPVLRPCWRQPPCPALLGHSKQGKAAVWLLRPIPNRETLNPAMVASNGVFFISSKIVEPLAEASFEAADGLAPRLATSWEGSPDGLSVTFKLREDVAWHDGKPFTAADVAFSALQIWKPLQNLGRVVFKDLDAVETPDEHTAVFRFAKPTPFQLVRNALPALTGVVPKHIYEQGKIEENAANTAPVGTGPFRFGEHKPGEYYLLKRNEAYWDKDQPLLDEIVYRVLPDRAAAAGALEADEIQLAAFSAVPLADLDRISKIDGIEVITKGYEALTYQLVIEINHRRKELANLKVRQAIAHAIDRESSSRRSSWDTRPLRPGLCRKMTSNSIQRTFRHTAST